MLFNVEIVNHATPALSVVNADDGAAVTYSQIKQSLGQQIYNVEGIYIYSQNINQLLFPDDQIQKMTALDVLVEKPPKNPPDTQTSNYFLCGFFRIAPPDIFRPIRVCRFHLAPIPPWQNSFLG